MNRPHQTRQTRLEQVERLGLLIAVFRRPEWARTTDPERLSWSARACVAAIGLVLVAVVANLLGSMSPHGELPDPSRAPLERHRDRLVDDLHTVTDAIERAE